MDLKIFNSYYNGVYGSACFLKKEKHNSFATNHFDKLVVARHPRK